MVYRDGQYHGGDTAGTWPGSAPAPQDTELPWNAGAPAASPHLALPPPPPTVPPEGYGHQGQYPPPGSYPPPVVRGQVLQPDPARQQPPFPPPPRTFPGSHGPDGMPTKNGGGGHKSLFRFAAAILLIVLVGPLALGGLKGYGKMLGLLGIHLPHVSSPYHPKTTDTIIGNAIVTEVKGVNQPALGEADFTFDYQRKVDKHIGLWPCWYSQTYHAEARGSAYVNLQPGTAWWAPGTGHYDMTRQGKQVNVVLSLPQPTLPNVHQVAIDNTVSGPIGKPDHSWTYPGAGCGALLNPHFSNDAMGSDMQKIAAIMVTGKPIQLDGISMVHATSSSVIRTKVLAAAEAEAVKMFTDDFIGPTVARLGYHLQGPVRINWLQPSPN